jgi:hypothetical protein
VSAFNPFADIPLHQTGVIEGFKKPFRAKPVVLGAHARGQQARRQRRSRLRLLVTVAWLAGLVFVFGMVATHLHISGLPVYYRNCGAARAAGVAPIRRGEPGYRRGLDADNDGIACEPYHGTDDD